MEPPLNAPEAKSMVPPPLHANCRRGSVTEVSGHVVTEEREFAGIEPDIVLIMIAHGGDEKAELSIGKVTEPNVHVATLVPELNVHPDC